MSNTNQKEMSWEEYAKFYIEILLNPNSSNMQKDCASGG